MLIAWPHTEEKKKMCAKFHGENWNIFFIAWIKGNNLNHFMNFFLSKGIWKQTFLHPLALSKCISTCMDNNISN